MQLTAKQIDDIMIFDLDLEALSSYEAKYIKDEIISIINCKIKKVIVNLKKVKFIDSEGLRTLTFCGMQLKNNHGDFKIINLQSQVRKLFELTKLLDFFKIYENEHDAIKSFP